MSLEDVEKKVMASAQQEANAIVEKAESEARAELERRSAALREDQQQKIRLAKAKADQEAESAVNTRRAEHAMKALEAKNHTLDAVFGQARDRILASDGFDYGRWLADQVRLAVAKGSGVLHCNERDRVTVEAVLRETASDQVSLAPENASMQGGVVLVGPSFDLDLTLEGALDDLRDERLVSLAESLFADVPAISAQPTPGD